MSKKFAPVLELLNLDKDGNVVDPTNVVNYVTTDSEGEDDITQRGQRTVNVMELSNFSEQPSMNVSIEDEIMNSTAISSGAPELETSAVKRRRKSIFQILDELERKERARVDMDPDISEEDEDIDDLLQQPTHRNQRDLNLPNSSRDTLKRKALKIIAKKNKGRKKKDSRELPRSGMSSREIFQNF